MHHTPASGMTDSQSWWWRHRRLAHRTHQMALTSALLALGNLHAGCSATTASRRSTGAATDVNPWGHPIAPDGARRVFSYTGTAPATPDRIYPLLCPVLEYDWIDDWSCTMEYSVSGVAEPGCAFRTSIQVGEQWLLTRHEPPTAIQYVVWLKQGWMVLDVTLRDLGDGTTELRWQRTFTAVRPLGRHLIGKMTEQQIGAEMAGLHGKLVAYLAVTAVDG